MKIGIPGALLYYYYGPYWVHLFEELGIEVITTQKTDKKTIDRGIGVSVPEICVPIKIYNGHVLRLVDQGVDYVFVPRMVSIEKGKFFCPKFMGLPDMIEHGIPAVRSKLLTMDIQSSTEDITSPKLIYPIAGKLGVSKSEIRRASHSAGRRWKKFRNLCLEGKTIKEAWAELDGAGSPLERSHNSLKIGLLGYVYDVYDEFISMDVTARLRQLGAAVTTFEMIPPKLLKKHVKKMKKSLFWTFSDKLLGAAYSMFREGSVDGVIHITAFGCGPDAFLGKLLEIESEKTGIPFMTVRIDEHTGENHLQTRVEAFVDMLGRKFEKAGERP